MTMFLFQYKVRPAPSSPHFLTIKLAIAAIYAWAREEAAAEATALAYLKQERWEFVSEEQTLLQLTYEGCPSSEARQMFRYAQEHGVQGAFSAVGINPSVGDFSWN